MKKRLIVVGAGIAGLNAAKEARASNEDWDVLLLGLEDSNTYIRTGIPNYISNNINIKGIMPYDDDWYSKRNIVFKKDLNVTGLDTNNKKVITDGGDYHYDSLVIATGASPFLPPIEGIDNENVLSIRTIADADRVIDRAKHLGVCTVIGGGLLGIEIAWAILQLGCKVNIIEHNENLLPRQTDAVASSMLLKALTDRGMNFYLNSQVDAIIGVDKTSKIRLKDARIIDSDFIILSTGVRPNIDSFIDTSLEINRGIIVNENMETNIRGVFAAGDVAEYDQKNYCIWPIAVSQGKVAGSNAVGKPMVYDEIKPFTQLNVSDLTLFTIGDIFSKDSRCLEKTYKNEGRHFKFLLKDDKIYSAVVLADLKQVLKIKKMIESKMDISAISYIEELLELL